MLIIAIFPAQGQISVTDDTLTVAGFDVAAGEMAGRPGAGH